MMIWVLRKLSRKADKQPTMNPPSEQMAVVIDTLFGVVTSQMIVIRFSASRMVGSANPKFRDPLTISKDIIVATLLRY
jgi:hypothetical protein